MRLLIVICFYIPLITNLLNVQVFIAKFISTPYSQMFAYASMGFLLLGTFLIFKRKQKFAPLVKMWVTFYILYYVFGLLANVFLDTQPPILRTLVPLVFFLAFSFLLSIPEYARPVGKLLAWTFFISVIALIVLNYYNFSLDSGGIYEYQLDRAGGVYGDANNSCVAAILSFVFIKYFIVPENGFQKTIKTLALLISVYGVLLTFSKTGFLTFLIVLGVVYHKLFTGKRILISIVLVPVILVMLVGWARTAESLSFEQKQRVESLVNIVTFEVDKVGFSDRDVLFKNMLSFIYENPFIGNGVEFSSIIRGHNTIVGVWADSGIVTFIFFLIVLLTYFKRSLFAQNRIKFFSLSALLTLTIFMLSLQTIINQGYLMVVFVLIAYGLYHPNIFSLDKPEVQEPSMV